MQHGVGRSIDDRQQGLVGFDRKRFEAALIEVALLARLTRGLNAHGESVPIHNHTSCGCN